MVCRFDFKFYQIYSFVLKKIFDATRKITYKNLDRWYTELRDIRPHIPCLCAVNKIDTAMEITKKSFSFPKKHDMPLYFVSAANGTNVVRLFRDAIRLANAYRMGDTEDFIDQVLRELEVKKEQSFTGSPCIHKFKPTCIRSGSTDI
jgi:Rab-like protein 2